MTSDETNRQRPPRRHKTPGLTPHQRAVLEAAEAQDKPTHAELAVRFASTRSAITETLRDARAKIHGHALASRGKAIRLRRISLTEYSAS